ncbi:MAG: alpha/beta hydrolase family protein [Candidatus Dormibacteria bacterium]
MARATADPATAPPRPGSVARRWRRRLVAVAAVLAGLAAVFYLGGGWYFSQRLYTLGLSAAVKRADRPTYDVRVRAITAESLTMALPGELDETVPGTWGVQWPGGAGEVGRILGRAPGTVTRSFHRFDGTLPAPGGLIAMNDSVFPLNPLVGLGLAYRTVDYRGPLGSYPAWFVPGRGDVWAITVHGNDLSRLDCMKIVPDLHRAGLPVLMITYRNDRGAPPAPNGLMEYGLTEWQDLQAAVRYALAHGAHRVVLVGYSMGGGIVASFLERSPLARDVAGTILDAPMLDFSRTVDLGAAAQRLPLVGLPLPQSLTDTAKWIASWRYGVDWGGMNYLARVARLRALGTPILLFQGLQDTTVPWQTSAALARALPRQVTYLTFARAGHLQEWNLDPTRYDAAVTAFLARTVG